VNRFTLVGQTGFYDLDSKAIQDRAERLGADGLY
jgi:hypothetical protein